MPWYGMHLIDRVRNQASATERSQRVPAHDALDPPSRTAQVVEATPTLFVVALWGMISAAFYCAASGISEWDIIMTMASAPLAMAVAGVVWGSLKSRLASGLDAAIVTGAAVGVLFLVAMLW